MSRVVVDGFCPMCGKRSLGVEVSLLRGPTPEVRCFHPDCPASDGVSKLLQDSEIHHIVRFDGDEEYGVFNAQHPLRERIDGALLDCVIHEEVQRFVAEGLDEERPLTGTWRVRAASEHNLDANWIWERL